MAVSTVLQMICLGVRRFVVCHQPGNSTTAEIQFHDRESFLKE
ncbi:hypothetical protein VB834_17235 [Limnoraphis robusta Tam1]|uniref:Uncharacterized protein n=1 Tax=Limnoraphis robusta CCNP1315 TaxID=3110306 RepID=A0ABU5TYV8_9CYAN|nr:hypothetical protein [Limnoraphis robusta]MEA5495957.1 hypothetical protein [Limnoraphis robusta BA-68 BA1]MEA5519985.1 hypothetical protein [Limnoraphis robusta CCNP1315]MEA5540766.1 hypothetical protein [Limnoraphis robusta Tam1]MEA5544909.1 hypothetical protein [Limnoraphis robusta CCNP1324]